jgi:hypothetical protein
MEFVGVCSGSRSASTASSSRMHSARSMKSPGSGWGEASDDTWSRSEAYWPTAPGSGREYFAKIGGEQHTIFTRKRRCGLSAPMLKGGGTADEFAVGDHDSITQEPSFQEALASTRRALRAKRQSRAAALSRSGRRLLERGEFNGALSVLAEAFALFPHPRTEYALARIYMLQGAWEAARTHLNTARAGLPSKKVGITHGLIRCALQQNDLRTAQRTLRKIQPRPLRGAADKMHLLLEIDLLLRRGQLERAERGLAAIAGKKLNPELKQIYSDIQLRLNTAQATSPKMAQKEIYPQNAPPRLHGMEHRDGTANSGETRETSHTPPTPPTPPS